MEGICTKLLIAGWGVGGGLAENDGEVGSTRSLMQQEFGADETSLDFVIAGPKCWTWRAFTSCLHIRLRVCSYMSMFAFWI
jgi:hypothetical protein